MGPQHILCSFTTHQKQLQWKLASPTRNISKCRHLPICLKVPKEGGDGFRDFLRCYYCGIGIVLACFCGWHAATFFCASAPPVKFRASERELLTTSTQFRRRRGASDGCGAPSYDCLKERGKEKGGFSSMHLCSYVCTTSSRRTER